MPQAPPGDHEEVLILRRRLAKVVAQLEAQEQLLRLERLQGSEPGLPSIYRTVQGLDLDATDRERKQDLMRNLFRSNRELRERIASFRRSAE